MDPFRNMKFEVEILGFVRAGFSKVSGLSHTVEIAEYREGGDNETPRKLPAQSTFENVTLERGISNDSDFLNWMNQIYNLDRANGSQGIGPGDDAAFRRKVVIYLKDKSGTRRKKWTVLNAWPSEKTVADLDATGNDVLIHTLVLANEGIKEETIV